MKKHLSTIILVSVLVVGLSLLLYPTISDQWNYYHQSRAIAGYEKAVEDTDKDTIKKIRANAKKYNKKLLMKDDRLRLSEEDYADYNSQLNLAGNGVMVYIEIPSINVSLPIYHGTDDAVLQVGVGHIAGTSLPVGGEGTHCVVSGHRGLTSSKLFTDIDQMVEGDIFLLKVLDETYTYQVDQIRIVLPDELNDLNIMEGQDYVTLVTCTPYGVNTHRLLVRGHRIANEEAGAIIHEDAKQIKPVEVAVVLGVILLILYIVIYKLIKNKLLFRFL